MNSKIEKQAQWWRYAAWTLPFVALSTLVSLDFLNLEQTYHIVSLIVIITFFAVSVFWWWWAIDAIRQMFLIMKRTEENFNEVKSTLEETKKIIKDDLGNR